MNIWRRYSPTCMDGLLLLDKPKGITSYKAVECVKRILGVRKAGHAGTLDPLATGLLIVCLNTATKMVPKFMSLDKEYEFVMLLGRETTTDDVEGEVIREVDVFDDVGQRLREVVQRFIGEIEQVPPSFSAIKCGGTPLYKLARRGKAVVPPSRRVFIHNLDIKRISGRRIFGRVVCSKGTYIRALCRDIGRALGVGGCLEELRRTSVGCFRVEDAIGLMELEKTQDPAAYVLSGADVILDQNPERGAS